MSERADVSLSCGENDSHALRFRGNLQDLR
jgi:hypothetical protein